MIEWFRKLFGRSEPVAPVEPPKPEGVSNSAVANIKSHGPQLVHFPIQPPELMAGVVPEGKVPRVAMDSGIYEYAQAFASVPSVFFNGFPGYPYLAQLTTRAEYRAFASSLSGEITREWIKLTSSESDNDATKKKITEIENCLKQIRLQQVVKLACEHDAYYGRGQILIKIDDQNLALPLKLSNKTIRRGSKIELVNVEPIWTTPISYNSIDPSAKDFYKPTLWYMLSKEVHTSRMPTIITRPVPDILKPAFNFSGMSLSQLAEPYVNNWLRTRDAVGDIVSNFSITALKTAMSAVLQGSDDGKNLLNRADVFTTMRSNQGLMLLDKDAEDMVQLNTPLGGLHELQAQSQEHMCSVAHMPAVVLTGISPSGFGNLAEGEMEAWRDWIKSEQGNNYQSVIWYIICIVQIAMYGEIDPDIGLQFNPLKQMTPKELSEMRLADSQAGGNYIDRNVIAPEEERERLARDHNSGYQGLDVSRKVDNEENTDPDGDVDDNDTDSDRPS